MTDVIDAHHHFWRLAEQEQSWRTPAHTAIEADYGPDDLHTELQAAGIDGTVLVQSVDEPAENDRLAAYAATARYVRGVVGWLPLSEPAAARAELSRVSPHRLCGVRTLVARDPLDWLTAPDTLAVFRELADRGLCWDVVPVTEQQVRAVIALAAAVPQLRIVVDHLARPPVDGGGHEPWAARLAALADHPGIALKVSVGIDVLTAWPRWQPDALTDYVAHAVRTFGPRRLMLASNWPVVELRRAHRDAWADLDSLLVDVGVHGTELAEVRGGTATRWYQLPTGDVSGTPGEEA